MGHSSYDSVRGLQDYHRPRTVLMRRIGGVDRLTCCLLGIAGNNSPTALAASGQHAGHMSESASMMRPEHDLGI